MITDMNIAMFILEQIIGKQFISYRKNIQVC